MAGAANTSGSSNTFVGDHVGLPIYNTGTGDDNTFVGANAGFLSNSGFDNTALGFSALTSSVPSGNYNTSVGSLSGFSANIGDGNTFVGYGAGYGNLDNPKNYNTEVGYSAGFSTKGSDNIFVGAYAGSNGIDIDQDVFIGASSCCESNTIRIGNSDSTFPPSQVAAFIAGIYGKTVDSATGTSVVVDQYGNWAPSYPPAGIKNRFATWETPPAAFSSCGPSHSSTSPSTTAEPVPGSTA